MVSKSNETPVEEAKEAKPAVGGPLLECNMPGKMAHCPNLFTAASGERLRELPQIPQPEDPISFYEIDFPENISDEEEVELGLGELLEEHYTHFSMDKFNKAGAYSTSNGGDSCF